MKLEKDFRELNRFSLNIEQVIIKFYNDYYKNGGKFPYNMLDYYINKYNSVYQLMYKRKESFINKLLSNVSDNFKNMLDRCEVRNSKEILHDVCKNYILIIKNDAFKYIPDDEDNKEKIYYRLFPVIENLYIDEIVDLYRYFVNYVNVNIVDNNEEILYYLQRLFVSYIYIILNNDVSSRYKYKYNGNNLEYDEVCERVLKEEVKKINSKVKVLQ